MYVEDFIALMVLKNAQSEWNGIKQDPLGSAVEARLIPHHELVELVEIEVNENGDYPGPLCEESYYAK